MAGIILPNRFSQQPQYPAPLDLQGLAKGAQLAINPAAGPTDLANNRVWTPNGNFGIVATPAGRTLNFDGSASYLSYTGYPEIVGNVGTLAIWFSRVGTASTYGHVYFGDSTITFQVDNNGRVYPWGVGSAQVFGSWFNTLNRSIIFVSKDGTAAGLKVYVDGVDTGLTFSGSPTLFPAGNKTLTLGRFVGGSNWDVNASVVSVVYLSTIWGNNETKAFHESRGNELYKVPSRRIWVAPAVAGTVALTGQVLTSSQGTLAPASTASLSGIALTSSQGTLTPTISVVITGQSLTSAQGLLVPNTSAALTGQSASSAQGTLTPATGGVVALTGQSIASAQGTLTPSTTVALTGQALTSGQGTLTPATGVTATLTGQSATTAQGVLVPTITIQLTGQSLTSAHGSLSLDQYIWDTSQGKAQPGRGTFKPLKPHEMSEPEIVVVDIPEEESTYEHHPVADVKPIKLGPRAGITGIKLPPRRHPGATPAPVQNRDYKALMARAGTKTKTMKLSDFPVKQNKKYLTKVRGPATLKGN